MIAATQAEAHDVQVSGTTPSWTLGFRTLEPAQLGPIPLEIEGDWPAGLSGTLYRNGPARHDRDGLRYRHWFDGDGMVHAWQLRSGGVCYRAAYVQTDKYRVEQAEGRFSRAAYGTHVPGSTSVLNADDMNVANTGVLRLGDDLLALWEAGSAWALDPDDLRTRGRRQWREDLAGMPFSAHPRREADGTVWNFGADSARGLLVLYRFEATGALARVGVVPVPRLPMVHDFAVTEHYLVFVLTPFRMDHDRHDAGLTLAESMRWHGGEATRVLLIDKSDWSQQRMFELLPAFGLHLGNAWEAGSGQLCLTWMAAPDDRLFARGFQVMAGYYEHGRGASVALVTLDLQRGTATQSMFPEEAEFPVVDPRHIGRPHEWLVNIARSPTRQGYGYDRLQRRHLGDGRLDHWDHGPEILLEEHLVVPDPERSTECSGWLVGTALDLRRARTRLQVFDAEAVHRGPVAVAWLPHAVPLGLHGCFDVAARCAAAAT